MYSQNPIGMIPEISQVAPYIQPQDLSQDGKYMIYHPQVMVPAHHPQQPPAPYNHAHYAAPYYNSAGYPGPATAPILYSLAPPVPPLFPNHKPPVPDFDIIN